MAIRSFAAGECIYAEGSPCSDAFIVLSGTVTLTRSQGGAARAVTPRAIFGETGFLLGGCYQERAEAASSVTVQLLPHAALRQLLEESPAEIQKIFANLTAYGPPAMATTLPDEASEPGHFALQTVAKLADSVERVTALLHARCDALAVALKPAASSNHAFSDAPPAPAGRHLTDNLVRQLSELDALVPLLKDDTVTDILINGASDVFVEREGLLEKTDITFPADADVMRIAQTIVKAVGRKIDPNRPLVDARLLDGSRVNIIAHPLAVDGTSISIRKFSDKKITLDVMRNNKNGSAGLMEFLKIIGKCRVNTLISGGTGSGKTTLLNAISQFIDPRERIVTIEDAAELQLLQPHVVRLETRPRHPGMRPEEEVSMRDLVKNALRMRPDRIIVGEVRGPEAFDMMQAMNTGHEGSLTTLHSNHPRDALSRLENMISMADLQIPVKSLRYQIASALHLIIQISRMRDGQRRITFVSEVVGMEGDMITMHDLFVFVPEGEDDKGKITGQFKWTGIMPRFSRRIAYYGEMNRLEAAFGVKLPKNF